MHVNKLYDDLIVTSSKLKDVADDKKSIVTSSTNRVTFQLERNTMHGSFYDVTNDNDVIESVEDNEISDSLVGDELVLLFYIFFFVKVVFN